MPRLGWRVNLLLRVLLIAAHALALGDAVITANEREFSRIGDLVLENWLKERP